MADNTHIWMLEYPDTNLAKERKLKAETNHREGTVVGTDLLSILARAGSIQLLLSLPEWESQRKSGINIKTFMQTDEFRNVSTAYGLDSQVVANFYKVFASYFSMPKDSFVSFNNYYEPYKDKNVYPVTKSIEVNIVDHIVLESYIEKVPFPAKVKEHFILASVLTKVRRKLLNLMNK